MDMVGCLQCAFYLMLLFHGLTKIRIEERKQ